MNRNDLHRLTRTLMDEHGLRDWKIAITRDKNAAGKCSYRDRTIRMSEPLATVRTEESTRMTVLHEIAHALVGPFNDHNHVWRAKCLEIGGNGKSRYTDLAVEDRAQISKYTGTCPNGHVAARNARSEKMFRISCAKCSPFYDARFKFVWVENASGRALNAPAAARSTVQINWNQVAANSARRPAPQPARPAPIRPPARPRVASGSSNPDDLWGTGD